MHCLIQFFVSFVPMIPYACDTSINLIAISEVGSDEFGQKAESNNPSIQRNHTCQYAPKTSFALLHTEPSKRREECVNQRRSLSMYIVIFFFVSEMGHIGTVRL